MFAKTADSLWEGWNLRDGSQHRGKAFRSPIPEGSVINVVYNPDRPRRNSPYPFALVRVDDE